MKLEQYLDVDKLNRYVSEGLVTERYHNDFPLCIYTYGRKAVYDLIWDDVTLKTRGLIVNKETNEVIARPFEKFFNLDTGYRPETQFINLPKSQPIVQEKLDGFLCILYRYNGVEYIASKGSFHSDHAKWATEWYHDNVGKGDWLDNYTPVFEGINPDVQRIVVDYGNFKGLVLLALINNNTGKEIENLGSWANMNCVKYVKQYQKTLEEIQEETFEKKQNEEGYVCFWPQENGPSIRVKVKFLEYLRLHRLLTNVSPKHILEALSQPHLKAELEEYLNNSTPQFAEFTRKWIKLFTEQFNDIKKNANEIWLQGLIKFKDEVSLTKEGHRKKWALHFTEKEHKQYAPILFAWLDGMQNKADQMIWKQIAAKLKYEKPLLEDLE